MKADIYHDNECDRRWIKDKVVAIIGYGNQGRAQALNLRDSGVTNIIIGNREDSYREKAIEDGFSVHSIQEAALKSQVLFFLIPDEVQPEVWNNNIKQNIKEGDTLVVASGYNLFFKYIEVPSSIDAIMVAPRMIGEAVRQRYLDQEGYPCFVSAEQNASGHAFDMALSIASAIGATKNGAKSGAIESSVREETALDLFAEQAVWPTILRIFSQSFNILKEAGFSDEAILYEAYLSGEPSEVFSHASEEGLLGQLRLHSRTSQYGQLLTLLDASSDLDDNLRSEFKNTLYGRILSGEFADEWSRIENYETDKLNSLYQQAEEQPIAIAEKKLL